MSPRTAYAVREDGREVTLMPNGNNPNGVENLNGNPTGPVPVTDHQPQCWKCGRVLGRYVSRPWSIKCRRCKATNQGVLKGTFAMPAGNEPK